MSADSTMSSDNDRQGKFKPKKRQHIVISEADSSDEYDTRTTKSRRKQGINKLRSDMRKLGKETKVDLEASCSSHSVQGDKHMSEKKINGKVSSDVFDSETFPKGDPGSSQTTKSPEKSEVNKDAPPVSSDANENDKKNENSQGVDKCPICLAPFEHQEIAIPSSCDHRFCYDCIIKWSKNTNTCPVDRLEFNKIEVRLNISGKPMRHIRIEPRTQHNTDEEDSLHSMVFTTDSEEAVEEDRDEPVEDCPHSSSSHENQQSSPITVNYLWGACASSDNNSSASAQTNDERSSSHSAESYRLEPSFMDSSNSASYWDNSSPASSFISSSSSLSPF